MPSFTEFVFNILRKDLLVKLDFGFKAILPSETWCEDLNI